MNGSQKQKRDKDNRTKSRTGTNREDQDLEAIQSLEDQRRTRPFHWPVVLRVLRPYALDSLLAYIDRLYRLSPERTHGSLLLQSSCMFRYGLEVDLVKDVIPIGKRPFRCGLEETPSSRI